MNAEDNKEEAKFVLRPDALARLNADLANLSVAPFSTVDPGAESNQALPSIKVEKAFVVSCMACGIIGIAQSDGLGKAKKQEHEAWHRNHASRVNSVLEAARRNRAEGNKPQTPEAAMHWWILHIDLHNCILHNELCPVVTEWIDGLPEGIRDSVKLRVGISIDIARGAADKVEVATIYGEGNKVPGKTWQQRFPYPRVMDADGWPGDDGVTWDKTPITYTEYLERRNKSTCEHTKYMLKLDGATDERAT